tara:strand:+ start:951 stop:1142 length:192 start_codon:yes stop_codon:yes gene_type:complete
MEMNDNLIPIFKYGILPLGISLFMLGTLILFKNFKGDQNIKILGASWLFLGTVLILIYFKSIF